MTASQSSNLFSHVFRVCQSDVSYMNEIMKSPVWLSKTMLVQDLHFLDSKTVTIASRADLKCANV